MGGFLDFLGAVLMVLGTGFLLLGGLGLIRMPDVFNRIQAGTKTTTLGTLLTLFGAACIEPGWIIKLLLIGLFLMFTNPLSGQVLARSAARSGAEKTQATKIDRYADHLGGQS